MDFANENRLSSAALNIAVLACYFLFDWNWVFLMACFWIETFLLGFAFIVRFLYAVTINVILHANERHLVMRLFFAVLHPFIVIIPIFFYLSSFFGFAGMWPAIMPVAFAMAFGVLDIEESNWIELLAEYNVTPEALLWPTLSIALLIFGRLVLDLLRGRNFAFHLFAQSVGLEELKELLHYGLVPFVRAWAHFFVVMLSMLLLVVVPIPSLFAIFYVCLKLFVEQRLAPKFPYAF